MGWDNGQYLKFKAQRTRPATDLAARIPIENPTDIIDVGCGPGNSSRVLKDRYPNAHVLGADSSGNMLDRAREDNPDMEFVLLDAGGDISGYNSRFDVVFSNACLQWIPDHKKLLARLFALLKPGGTLAVQIPMNFDASPMMRLSASVRSFRPPDATIDTYTRRMTKAIHPAICQR